MYNPKVGRPSAAEKRGNTAEQLKTVALDLFAAQGYGQVTIKQIASSANVNTAMIYYYFDDKESLCRAAIEDAAAQVFSTFQVAIDTVDDPKEKIHRWLETHIAMMATIRKMVKVSLDLKIDNSRKDDVSKSIDLFYDLETKTLTEFIKKGIDSGEFRAVKIDDARRVISTFLDGAMIRSLIRPDFDLERTINAFWEILWSYLSIEPTTASPKNSVLPIQMDK